MKFESHFSRRTFIDTHCHLVVHFIVLLFSRRSYSEQKQLGLSALLKEREGDRGNLLRAKHKKGH